MGNCHSSPRRHRKLPAELSQQIFYCLNLATRRKFICGLGWDFYAMSRQSILIKTKRVRNSHGNRWDGTNTEATVAADGLNVSNNTNALQYIYAEKGFPISSHCRVDKFPGTICYYYEIKGHRFTCGLSDGAIFDNPWFRNLNSYASLSRLIYQCWLAGEPHQFELPEGVVQLKWKSNGSNVFGCGLLIDPDKKLAIFFTLNGQLMGRRIPISPTVDCLFPAVKMMWNESSFETNFGDDSAKPFEYDIKNCPGLGLDCI